MYFCCLLWDRHQGAALARPNPQEYALCLLSLSLSISRSISRSISPWSLSLSPSLRRALCPFAHDPYPLEVLHYYSLIWPFSCLPLNHIQTPFEIMKKNLNVHAQKNARRFIFVYICLYIYAWLVDSYFGLCPYLSVYCDISLVAYGPFIYIYIYFGGIWCVSLS